MKTQLKSRSCQGIISFLLLLVNNILSAQVPLPFQWETFLSDPVKNKLVRDTILSQTFEGKVTDNWLFTPDTFELFDAALEGIENQTGNYSYKLLPGSELHFATLDPAIYDSIYIKASFAGKGLGLDESLILRIEYMDKDPEIIAWSVASQDNFQINYKEKAFGEGKYRTNPIQVGGKPVNIQFRVTNKHISGFYCLDHIFTLTNLLPSYSLFTGTGDWENKTCWSHLPVFKGRNALIDGNVTVNTPTHCKEAWLSKSVLTISDHSLWTCKDLHLFDSEIRILPQGKLWVEDQIHIHQTLDEKGKWYFISFPFDVYKEGIDKNFELQDDQPNSGGNFLYVLTYNGLKRGEQNLASGNWDVMTIPDPNSPIFEMGKGYLIAIDENATQNTLIFSSVSGGQRPGEFKTHTITIDIPEKTSIQHREHYGWHLCGNPFLSSLSLKQLKEYPELDPYIYLYDGYQYIPFLIENDPVVPPLGSFFIKINKAVSIQLQNISPESLSEKIRMKGTYTQVQTEPHQLRTTDFHPESNSPTYSLDGRLLVIKNMYQTGFLSIYDLTGRKLQTHTLSPGDQSIHLTLTKGIYLFQLTSGSYQAQHKFVITQ